MSVCSPSGRSLLVRFSCSSVLASDAGVGFDGSASVLGRSRHWLDLWGCKLAGVTSKLSGCGVMSAACVSVLEALVEGWWFRYDLPVLAQLVGVAACSSRSG